MNSGAVLPLPLVTRPVRPDDDERFRRLWPRLSRETVHRRFHAPVRRLPASAVRRLVEVDHDRREAVVAVVGGEVVGVARYDRSPADPATAELAVVVEDAWQGMGVARQLLSELVALARARGVAVLTGTVQPDNTPVLALVRRLLPTAVLTSDGDVLAVRAACPPAALSRPQPTHRKDLS
jgi:GNAT superfamily N-acetyltransferase